MNGFPRASWLNVLASSPMSVIGLASSSTAIENAKTVNNGQNTTGAGILGAGLLAFDGTNFQRAQASVLTDAFGFNAFNQLVVTNAAPVFNGNTWDRMKSATAAHNTTGTGLLGAAPLVFNGTNYLRLSSSGARGDADGGDYQAAVGPYVFNGSTYDRLRGSTDGTTLTGAVRTIPAAATFSNITTNTTTTVKNAPGVITGLVINTAGTTSTVILKDNATVIGTFTTTVQGALNFDAPINCATTIVAVTAGAAAADITVLYR